MNLTEGDWQILATLGSSADRYASLPRFRTGCYILSPPIRATQGRTLVSPYGYEAARLHDVLLPHARLGSFAVIAFPHRSTSGLEDGKLPHSADSCGRATLVRDAPTARATAFDERRSGFAAIAAGPGKPTSAADNH